MTTLTEYLNLYLGDLVTTLNVSASSIAFVVDSTLVTYGVSTEAEATDLTKLHKIANKEMWQRLMQQATSSFDFSADGNSYKSSQIYDFCKQNYFDAMSDASEYLAEFEIGVTSHRIDGRMSYDEYQSGSVCYF